MDKSVYTPIIIDDSSIKDMSPKRVEEWATHFSVPIPPRMIGCTELVNVKAFVAEYRLQTLVNGIDTWAPGYACMFTDHPIIGRHPMPNGWTDDTPCSAMGFLFAAYPPTWKID